MARTFVDLDPTNEQLAFEISNYLQALDAL